MSANSGDEIYNNALVTGQTPDGQPVRVRRGQGQAPSAVFSVITSPAPGNPSFDVDASTWSIPGSGALARDTATFHSSPASGQWISSSPGTILNEDFTGTFNKGTVYKLSFWLKAAAVGTQLTASFGLFNTPGVSIDKVSFDIASVPTAFTQYTVTWVPTTSYASGVQFQLFKPNSGSATINVDTLLLMASTSTLVERRGFSRAKVLQVSNALPSDLVAATGIADTWLPGHRITPFKGTVTLTGNSSLRDIRTGEDVPLERLLLNVGQLIRFSDRIDPDTGGHGRDGRIAAVKYWPAQDRAEVTIDNSRQSFEALLARLGALSG